jgi:AcrR family transcriptional regulator
MPAKSQSTALEHRARAPGRDDLRDRGPVTEIQRARMITAMIDVVSARGRADATVAHVVARSGVSRRTFYEVFDDFEGCFLAALEHSLACASQYVLDVYSPTEKWRTRIGSALVGLLEFLDDEPAMGRLCVVETLGAGVRVQERRMAVVDVLVATVDEGRKESRSASKLPPLTAEGVVGGVLSVLHARLLAMRASGARTSRGSAARVGGRSKKADTEGSLRQAGGHVDSLLELSGALTAMVVLPYLGPTVAGRELARSTPERKPPRRSGSGDPLRGLEMRLTYRTVRVLIAIATTPDASNRKVATAAGIDDQGQISKLLARLEKLGLVSNHGAGRAHGSPNAWSLTKKGVEVERLVAGQMSAGSGA